MATTTYAPLLTIGQIAERAGLRTSHIRFYERVGVRQVRGLAGLGHVVGR